MSINASLSLPNSATGIIRYIAAVVASACRTRRQKIDDLCHALPPKSTAASSIHFRSTDVYWRVLFPFTLPPYNFVLLNISRHCGSGGGEGEGRCVYSFVESCSVGKIWKSKEYKFTRPGPEVRRCGGMRQKHCIRYTGGVNAT